MNIVECPSCALRIELEQPTQETVFCPQCGARFCEADGHDLSGSGGCESEAA